MPFAMLPSCTTINKTPMENLRFLSKGSTIENETMSNVHPFDWNAPLFVQKRNPSTTFFFPTQQTVPMSNIRIGTDELVVGYDVNIKLPIKTIFKIKAKIKSVSKFVPKPFID